jgi:response regulator RpfG family c-di-GMP phosphodiesterase
VREISAAQLAIIYAMAKMAEFRDMETGAHLERVRDYCNIITNDLIYNGKYRDILTQTYIENVNDALISKRVYKGARTHQDTMDIILDGRDKHFDPAIVDSFHAREQEFKRIAYAESEEGVYED